MNSDSMKVLLGIERRFKDVPYPSEEREDGGRNVGFRDLKGDAGAIQSIPEVQDCPALQEALSVINAPETPFFTVGCEKSLNRRGAQFWKKGFLEFSFNYAEIVQDAIRYFPMFFHFSQSKQVQDFTSNNAVRFFWEIQEARFVKINQSGFTCAVWITTGDYPTAAECEAVWDAAVRQVKDFFVVCRISNLPPSGPIYAPSPH
jgi:hypothetical protein